MGGQLAIGICGLGIGVLFYFNRDRSVATSKALWVPVIWIWLACSRGISNWFGMGSSRGLEGTLDGNPLDAAVIGVVALVGAFIVFGRRKKARAYLSVITPIIFYSVYCLISVVWSPYQVPALKRWTKDVGDVVMVLIIAMENQPLGALRRVYSRAAFVLFPLSIALIRYSTLGRVWDNDGKLAIVGVTDNKNMLGLIAFVISLGVAWDLQWLLTNRGAPNRRRRLVAEGIALVFGLYLLAVAHSSTSEACFFLGTGLMLATHLRIFRRRPSRVHLLCSAIILGGGFALLSGDAAANALGRDSNLSGRTFMWAAMLPAVSNPMIGVGFDSFWTSPNAAIFHHNLDLLHWWHAEQINEAHNGYIEVYLNLGWIGVGLIGLILTTGYWRACKAFRRDPVHGSLMLAYIIAGSIYGITEAGFRTLNPMWIFILLAVVSTGGANARLFADETAVPFRMSAGGGRGGWWQPGPEPDRDAATPIQGAHCPDAISWRASGV
jgi:exopolysaccharide production protein ExoQ